jgi:hypothetical protein
MPGSFCRPTCLDCGPSVRPRTRRAPTNDGCGTFTRQTPRCVGRFDCPQHAQNNCRASILGSQKHALPDFHPNERKLGSFRGSVGRSRRANGDSPLDLHRMPPVALNCGDPPVVESTGDISCGGDALSTQFLNGCHGGFVTHQPCRLVWFDVVHWTFPAGIGASRERTSSYFNPGLDFYPGATWKCEPGGMPMDAASSASLNCRGGFPLLSCGATEGPGIHGFRWDRRDRTGL